TPGGPKNVAHQAMGVHAHQHWFVGAGTWEISAAWGVLFDVALGEGNVRLAIHFAFISDHAEFAEPGGHQRLAYAADVALVLHAVANQFGDRQHLQPMVLTELHQVRHARHGAVVVHDLADHAGGGKAGEPSQVHGGFGLASAHQHTTAASAQREYVPRTRQVCGTGRRINCHPDGVRAIVGRDTGGNAVARVNGLAESGAELRCVLRRHGPDAQVIQALLRHGQANQAAAIASHEVDGFRCDPLGGKRQVAFILAVFVVHNHDHAPGADLLNGAADVRKWRLERHFETNSNRKFQGFTIQVSRKNLCASRHDDAANV